MLLSFLDIPYDGVAPESLKLASAELLAVNPLGQVPVLIIKESGVAIRDSNAILVYLALTHDKDEAWLPRTDAVRAAKVQEWLSYGTSEVNHALLWVRIKNKFSWDIPVSYDEALSRGRVVLAFLQAHLARPEASAWLAPGDHPSLADIAVFPYVALADSSSSGAITLAEYPAVAAWVDRVKALPKMAALPPW